MSSNAVVKDKIKRSLVDLVTHEQLMPQHAADKLRLARRTYYMWLSEDPSWRMQISQAQEAIGDEYVAMNYKAAKEGSVAAIKIGLQMHKRLDSDALVQNILNVDMNLLTDVQLDKIARLGQQPQLSAPEGSDESSD